MALDIRVKRRYGNANDLGYTQSVYDKCQKLSKLWGYAEQSQRGFASNP